MALEADYLELPSNQILNLYNMHSETERIRNELSGRFGSQESMLELES